MNRPQIFFHVCQMLTWLCPAGSGFFAGPEFGTLRAVLVDLFVLAEAEVFLGNPLSTFSAIICSLREVWQSPLTPRTSFPSRFQQR